MKRPLQVLRPGTRLREPVLGTVGTLVMVNESRSSAALGHGEKADVRSEHAVNTC
jgi:hypothetical protein